MQKQVKNNQIIRNKNKPASNTDFFDKLNNYNFNFLFDIKKVLFKDISFGIINIDKKKY